MDWQEEGKKSRARQNPFPSAPLDHPELRVRPPVPTFSPRGPSICFTQWMPCSWGSISNGQRALFTTMAPFCSRVRKTGQIDVSPTAQSTAQSSALVKLWHWHHRDQPTIPTPLTFMSMRGPLGVQ